MVWTLDDAPAYSTEAPGFGGKGKNIRMGQPREAYRIVDRVDDKN